MVRTKNPSHAGEHDVSDLPTRVTFNNTHVTESGVAHMENFVKRRPVIAEVAFVEDNSPVWGRFFEVIKERQWEQLIAPPTTYNLNIVREFYTNFADQNENGAVFLRGRWVDFSERAIAEHFHIPCEGDDAIKPLTEPQSEAQLQQITEVVAEQGTTIASWEWTKAHKPKTLARGLMNDEARRWLKFVDNRLHPNSRSGTIPYHRVCLLFCLMTDQPVNAARLIRNYLQHNSSSCGLPSMITEMARRAGVPQRRRDEEIQPPKPRTAAYAAYLANRGKRRRPDEAGGSGTHADIQEEQAEEEAAFDANPPASAFMDFSVVQAQLDIIIAEQRRAEERQNQQSHQLQQLQEQQNRLSQDLRRHATASGHYMSTQFRAVADRQRAIMPPEQQDQTSYAPPPTYDAYYSSMWGQPYDPMDEDPPHLG